MIRTLPRTLVLTLGAASLVVAPALAGIDISRLPAPAPIPRAATPRAAAPRAGEASRTRVDGGLEGKKPAGTVMNRPRAERLAELGGGIERLKALEVRGLEGRVETEYLRTAAAVHAMAGLLEANQDRLQVAWHEEDGTPRSLNGANLLPYATPPSDDPETMARTFLREYREILRLDDPDRELHPFRVERAADGYTAVRFAQKWRDVPVWGRDVVVRLSPAGRVIGFSGHSVPTPKFMATAPAIPAEGADRSATAMLSTRDRRATRATGRELVFFPHDGVLRLAWKVMVEGGLDYRREAFVDARSGEFLHDVTLVYHEAVTGSGIDLSNTNRTLNVFKINSDFFMINTTKSMFDASGQLPNSGKGIIWLINANNGEGDNLTHVTSTNKDSWGNGNRNAVSAAFFASQVFDYYKNVHNRNSIDDKGMNMQLVTNFKSNFANAFWNGTFMIFGNGDNQTFSDLAGSLDVTSHEMSHGVTEHTANLIYELQPGALNEHFSDAFGVATDFFVNPGTANFLLGEDVTTPGTAGDGLRNMQDPHNAFSEQPAHMNEFRTMPNDDNNDHGGVHVNSGIPNRAFFLAATGSGMTVNKAERIWYRALSQHLVRNSQFVDFRIAITQSADELFGAASTERTAVVAALDAVGIPGAGGGGGGGTPPPPPLPDNQGTDFVAVGDTITGQIFRVEPEDFSTILQITQIALGPGGRPSFTDDGSFFTWVGQDGNVYAAQSNGQGAVPLSDQGGWWSVAINAGGTLLAATTTEEDGTIYVFDLNNAANNASYNLTTQNSSGGSQPDNVVFADVLEFAAGSDFILYDALNRASLVGETYEYWDVNLLRLDNGSTLRVFQPLPRGESVGDPTFAQNSDNRIAFDYADGTGTVDVIGFDFQTGQAGLIAEDLPDVGRPGYSGDDSQVYFQAPAGGDMGVWRVDLASDGITASADPENWATEAFSPVLFTIGQRPTPVTLVSYTATWTADEIVLDWRVADAAEVVGFHVERRPGTAESFERRTSSLLPAVLATDGRYRFEDAAPADADHAAYRLIAVERNGAVRDVGQLEVERNRSGLAELRPVLLPAAPNPFSGETTLRFVVPAALSGRAGSVTVHDVRGRLVARLIEAEPLEAGEREIRWDGRSESGRPVAAGPYFVRLALGRSTLTQKVLVSR